MIFISLKFIIKKLNINIELFIAQFKAYSRKILWAVVAGQIIFLAK